jgi:hypothetical protein
VPFAFCFASSFSANLVLSLGYAAGTGAPSAGGPTGRKTRIDPNIPRW